MWQVLVQQTAMRLGLLELKEGHGAKAGDKRPEEEVTAIVLTFNRTWGLPTGLFARRPGDGAVTFVNPNKMQLMAPGGLSAMCKKLLEEELLGGAFAPEYKECMCQADKVGASCPSREQKYWVAAAYDSDDETD